MNCLFLSRLLFFILVLLANISNASFVHADPKINKVCFNDNCFSVELALTPQKQRIGLMFRDFLPPGHGMLFIFDKEDIWPFYMKNTSIPLDIIWINSQRKVVFIKENAIPCREEPCPIIYPDNNAIYVLELNAGTANILGLEPGCLLKFIESREKKR
ncbi:MAG: DUF192 domain-containing protein [Candidatus Omnitrophica bacterium]|nr:DUF192 domain-containing protein [Candidatus Omnitrophota bacterium]MDD5429787.1 DUF192 domain-containing protein [Candidatus Omnitrophota bacterium]